MVNSVPEYVFGKFREFSSKIFSMVFVSFLLKIDGICTVPEYEFAKFPDTFIKNLLLMVFVSFLMEINGICLILARECGKLSAGIRQSS